MQGAAQRAWSAAIDDFDRIAASHRDGSVEHTQTGAGPLGYRTTGADFGPIRMRTSATENSYLADGALLRGRWMLFLGPDGPGSGCRGTTRMNGLDFGQRREDAFLYAPGAEFRMHVAAGQRWTMLVLDDAPLRGVLDGPALPAEAGCFLMPGFAARAPGLSGYLRDLATTAEADPAVLSGGAVAAAVVETLAARLAAGFAGEAKARTGRAVRRQVRLASAAIDFLHASLGQPVYSEAVAEALGVTPRVVNNAFNAVYGMSLHQYLRLRRLNLARRRLLAGGDATLVKQVALDLGLWHFGRFAQAYRELFGETPSETLMRRGA